MFKWPGVPSPRAPEHELADYAELVCWQQRNTSATALTQDLGRLAENEYSDGVPEEDEIPKDVENAYLEIERRISACGGGYPFVLGDNGDTLHTDPEANGSKSAVYKYLLLATRLNMDTNRCHAGIDGTHLLEKLSAETCRDYFGHRAESMVFGTSDEAPGFQQKIDDLCKKLREGDGYRNRVLQHRKTKDGKLDVVVWKHFSDKLAGKLIAFGQCKTGTNYKDTLTQLQPDSFCRKWMQSFPSNVPVRMFFVAEALPQNDWYNLASDAGLLFDRCRIVDFSSEVGKGLANEIKGWTAAAAQTTGLQFP